MVLHECVCVLSSFRSLFYVRFVFSYMHTIISLGVGGCISASSKFFFDFECLSVVLGVSG